MKCKFTLLLVFLFSAVSLNSQSQDILKTLQGGEFKFNEDRLPCLTDDQRTEILQDIKDNILMLKSQKRLVYETPQKRASHPLFIWPVKKKDDVPYNDVWAISNYVDQNTAYPNKLKDYNCGAKTYDTNDGYNHLGVDIFSWPFTWKMMDNDEVEIIAAAPGQIIAIGRNKADRSCSFNDNVWNAVYIQHDDGSVAFYGHMKKDSPTSKIVGDQVATGEYLGIMGSSGNSTGPHLHFEVYSEIEWQGAGKDILVDPFAGSCNSLNSDTWWQEQKPYVNTNINAALTHSAAPIFPTCPDQEITNEQNAFAENQSIYFATYLRDQVAGTSINLKILKPDGSVYNAWTYALVANYTSSYWYWVTKVPNIAGNWTWQVSYQGQVVEHKFTSGTLSVDDQNFQTTSIYPNPFNNVVNIKSNSLVQEASVTDILGKTVMKESNRAEGIREINLQALSSGLYFLTLEGGSNQKKIIKLFKE